MSPTILLCELERLWLPLTRPYRLSFTTLEAFEAIILRLHLDTGRELLGEVVPLPGYTPEDPSQTFTEATRLVPLLRGIDLVNARKIVTATSGKLSLARSLFLSAIDSASLYDQPVPDALRKGGIPIVFALAADDPAFLRRAEAALADGYETLKVKIGVDPTADMRSITQLKQAVTNSTAVVRFDANQAYDMSTSLRFASVAEDVLGNNLDLLEQPFAKTDWRSFEMLANRTNLALMLDESIWNKNDVRRAADAGARCIKLKLCKHGGIAELIQLAQYARTLALKVVIGNGVATDVANLLELLVYANYRELFHGASESNGFAKLSQNVLDPELSISKGKAVLANSENRTSVELNPTAV